MSFFEGSMSLFKRSRRDAVAFRVLSQGAEFGFVILVAFRRYRIYNSSNGFRACYYVYVMAGLYGGFPKIRGTLFWGPYHKDPTI